MTLSRTDANAKVSWALETVVADSGSIPWFESSVRSAVIGPAHVPRNAHSFAFGAAFVGA